MGGKVLWALGVPPPGVECFVFALNTFSVERESHTTHSHTHTESEGYRIRRATNKTAKVAAKPDRSTNRACAKGLRRGSGAGGRWEMGVWHTPT